ncbi:MAG: DUF4340 domain-containing protein [Polyangiaceae bacterium]|nr:DUF4340 domain-containing protein [Polyangiaceae bacterium]
MSVVDDLKKHPVTFGLVAAMLAAGVWVYAQRDAVGTAEREGRKHHLFSVYRQDDVSVVQVERDGRTYTLRRKSSAPDAGDDRLWRIEVDGKTSLADQFAVDRAMSAIELTIVQRSIRPTEVNRAQFGLEKPRYRVTLTMGKLTSTMAIGGPAPKPEDSVYVEADGQVAVVRKESFATLDLPADALRTRTVVPYLSNDCRAITLAQPSARIDLVRGPGATWQLDGGARLRADRAAVDKVLGAFGDMKADHFVSEAEAKAAQAGAVVVTVSMRPTDDKRPAGELTVGGACPGHPSDVVLARRLPDPLFACVGRGAMEGLLQEPASFVDARAFSLREDEVEEIILEEGATALELARKDKGWRERRPVEAEVALEQARALLKTLTTAKSEVRPEVGALDGARAKVTLNPARDPDATAPQPEIVEVFRADKDGRVPVRRAQDGAVLRLSREDGRAFLPRSTALRSTRIVDVSVERLRRISLSRPDGKHVLARTLAGVWTVAEPRDLPVDIGAVGRIADVLSRLTADEWIADEDDGSFGLARPRMSFELSYKEGDADRQVKVELGDLGKAGVYGRLVGQKGVFVAPRATEDAISSWAIDLAQTAVDASEVRELTLSSKGAKVTLVSTGDGFRFADGATLPTSRLVPIRDALRELRADGVVHLGAAHKDEGFESPSLEITGKRADGKPYKLVFGAGDAWRGSSVTYARKDGVDVVYAVAASRLKALLALLS